eukprot:scaffold22646_cov68-Phaeocystis_antarctica.AAC.6
MQTQPMQPAHGVMPQQPTHGRLGGGDGRAAGAACLLGGASPTELVANGLWVPSGLAGTHNGTGCCAAAANGLAPSCVAARNGLSAGFWCAEPPAHAGTS